MALELFDANYYLAANPDLAAAGIDSPDELYQHFRNAGLNEGRAFSPFVDINYYRLRNPELASFRITSNRQLYDHMREYGIGEGRDFSPIIDLNFYLSKNPDLGQAFGSDRTLALQHLIASGINENRPFSQFIDLDFYAAANPDLQQAFGNNREQLLDHLLNVGIFEGRQYLPGDLGVLNGAQTVGENPQARPVVNSLDSEDYYHFRLNEFRDVRINGEGSEATTEIALFRDSNNNGILDEIDRQNAIAADKTRLSQLDLFGVGPGSYFVNVSHLEEDTPYKLDVFSTPARILSQPDIGGNSLNAAHYVGDLLYPQAVNGYIDSNDPVDFYSFTLSSRSDVSLRLNGLSTDDVYLRILQDVNANGVPDPGEVVASISDENRNPNDINGDGRIDVNEYFISLLAPSNEDIFPNAIRAFDLNPGTYFINVSRLEEDTSYDLRMDSIPVDVPTSGARNLNPVGFATIGVLRDRFEVADFIGEANPYDMYEFSLEDTRNVNFQLDRIVQPTDFFLIHDINKDDIFTFQEFLAFPTTEGDMAPELDRILGPGTYFLGVAKKGSNTPYLLTMEESDPEIAPDAAGNTAAAALDAGVLAPEAKIYSDYIATSDPDDYYRFTLQDWQQVGLYLYDMSANAQLSLSKDLNGNGAIEPSEVILASESKGAYQDQLTPILGPGTYTVRVSQALGDTTYSLWMDALAAEIPPPVAGNGVADAFDLGLLDRIHRQSGIVRDNTPNDFYRFQVDRPRDVSVFLDGLSGNADLRLIQDRNGNGLVEPEEIVALSAQGGATLEELQVSLGPGEYHLWVSRPSGETYYDLTLAPEQFDRSYGYGMLDAAAAVASAIGVAPFPQAAPLGGSNWHLDMVNAPAAWERGYTGAGVTVAVIDGSLDYTHPDLQGQVWQNVDEITGNGIDDDGNGFIDDVRGWNFRRNTPEVRSLDPLEGHASHVAGIVAGNNDGVGTTGVAPGAKIMPVPVLDAFTGTDEDIVAGIRYAVDNGARVINLSLGGGAPSDMQLEALRYANDRGVVVVMAAGNDGLSLLGGGKRFSPVNYPAGLAGESGISVGSVTRDRAIAEFTNRAGTEVLDYLVAPGEDIYSALPINRYDFWEGTSMAAPMVAGVAALMLQANPNLTPEQVEQILTGTANPNGIIEDGAFDFLG